MNATRPAAWAGALLAIGVLTAACSSAPSRTASASSPAVANNSAAPGQSGQSAMARGAAYTQCMRSHGLPQFPDPAAGPNGQGVGWQMGPGSSVNLNSPQYQAAVNACGPLPNLNGGAPPPPLTAAQERQYLTWAACIRAHGVPSFKDPTFPGGRPQFTTSGNGVQMGAAEKACANYLQGVPGGSGVTSG